MAGKAITMFDSVLRELLDATRTAAIREAEAKADATQIGELLKKVALLETRPTDKEYRALVQNNRDLRDGRNGIAPPVLENLFTTVEFVLQPGNADESALALLKDALDKAKDVYTVLPF